MSRAVDRYLSRHAESVIELSPGTHRWDNVLVIPCYRESPALINRLSLSFTDAGQLLVVVVLNRPDSEPEAGCNTALRGAIHALPQAQGENPTLFTLGDSTDLLLLDLDAQGPLDASEGVGLARKAGCDLALAWHARGYIHSPWINNTDADALLPDDYFTRLPAQHFAALCWPFCHDTGESFEEADACARYELSLHHYVLGLAWAGSPYAFHTIGSCISVHAEHYAQVGGVPRRNGAEDFYLLNKLVKTGEVLSLPGDCLTLQARPSDRVPFGTGPAIRDILADNNPDSRAMYYHPDTFTALRAVMQSVPALPTANEETLEPLVAQHGCDAELADAAVRALNDAGLTGALAHCRKHSNTGEDFQRHFHQWFDGFRTLKFLHRLRDSGYKDRSLINLAEAPPEFWPALDGDAMHPETWLRAARRHLQWRCHDSEYW